VLQTGELLGYVESQEAFTYAGSVPGKWKYRSYFTRGYAVGAPHPTALANKSEGCVLI
jgi:hypothetical protein